MDLTHLVDDNWLEGSVKGKTGIFPTSYVKVGPSSMQEWYGRQRTVAPLLLSSLCGPCLVRSCQLLNTPP